MFSKYVKKSNSTVKNGFVGCAAHCDYFVH
jgi:hypothetical protein